MLNRITKLIPKFIKNWLQPLKIKWVDNPRKRNLFLAMQKKHQEILAEIKGKEKVKVVFLVIHKSVWKVDPVFQKMLKDPFFEPLILICPYTPVDEQRMLEDMQECYEYFEGKAYPLLLSYHQEKKRWRTLEEIQPDIVFFTNPHKLTRKEYYEDAYLNYLTCYVPYYSDVASNYNVYNAYNGVVQNVVWLYFASSAYSLERAKRFQANRARNVILSGMPNLECLIQNNSLDKTSWKSLGDRKKIIYAPHQSVLEKEPIHLSTFIEVANFMVLLSEKYQDEIQWSFKPHPLLKQKLYEHPSWGKDKTDLYYLYWEKSAHTQLDTGDYIELFKTSDALIHDCGSFVFDYLLTGKPCAYLVFDAKRQLKAINKFGKTALECHHILTTHAEIEIFLTELVSGNVTNVLYYDEFYQAHIEPLYESHCPSEFILKTITSKISSS
jgi:hypothetical protein